LGSLKKKPAFVEKRAKKRTSLEKEKFEGRSLRGGRQY